MRTRMREWPRVSSRDDEFVVAETAVGGLDDVLRIEANREHRWFTRGFAESNEKNNSQNQREALIFCHSGRKNSFRVEPVAKPAGKKVCIFHGI
jgi:hypothetical protein